MRRRICEALLVGVAAVTVILELFFDFACFPFVIRLLSINILQEFLKHILGHLLMGNRRNKLALGTEG